MIDVNAIADMADMIVDGYAFTVEDGMVRVLNLHFPDKAACLNLNGELLETNMDDIEAAIVVQYYADNRAILEAAHA